MDYSAAADALMRSKILEDIYDRMSEDEKKTFVRMFMDNRSAEDIMAALQRQSSQLDSLSRKQQTFGEDFASNIAGNAVWAGAEWLLRRMARVL